MSKRLRLTSAAKSPKSPATATPTPTPEKAPSVPATAPATVAPYGKATPARKDGKTGPDPVALRDGRINPLREGKVFSAIRNGDGSTVAELAAATGLRDVTVRYFGISAGEAGILDAIRIGAEYRFVVGANDPKATPKAKDVRKAVLALRDAATATPAVASPTPAK